VKFACLSLIFDTGLFLIAGDGAGNTTPVAAKWSRRALFWLCRGVFFLASQVNEKCSLNGTYDKPIGEDKERDRLYLPFFYFSKQITGTIETGQGGAYKRPPIAVSACIKPYLFAQGGSHVRKIDGAGISCKCFDLDLHLSRDCIPNIKASVFWRPLSFSTDVNN